MKHVFSCLLQVIDRGEGRKSDLFGKEIYCECVAFLHGVLKITLVASVMFRRGTDVPTNFAMLTKGGAGFGGNVSHNFGTQRGDGDAIEIVIPVEGGMGREGWKLPG